MLIFNKAEDLHSGERRIVVSGETALDERFLLWFSAENNIPRIRINGKDLLLFGYDNDIEQLNTSLTTALNQFKIQFNYLDVPDVVGKNLEEAAVLISKAGLLWSVEREEHSTEYKTGTVLFQTPSQGITSTPYIPVKLTVANNTLPPKKNKNIPEKQSERRSIEDDEVFKRFLS